MSDVKVVCDRCHAFRDGLETPGLGTGGFYKVGKGTPWEQFARSGESIVCDECMHSDESYRKAYPPPVSTLASK